MTHHSTARRGTLTASEALALPVMFDVWPTVGDALGLGRTATYALARAGELPIPCFRIGRQLRARRSDLLRFLGMETSEGAAAATATPSSEPTTQTP